MADDDKMKVDKVRELLNKAIPLQFRSATMFTWAAASVTGHEFQAVGRQLEDYGRLELEDARRLIEKLVALGGDPVADVASFDPISFDEAGIRQMMDYEEEALEALHAVIPETGQEPRSEALEHLMEHMLMRKQEQVDFLERVRRGA